MTLLLYNAYSSKLTEDEKRDIDIKVLGNRVSVLKFGKKVYIKGKVIILIAVLGRFISISTPKNDEGIGGVPMLPHDPIIEVVPSVGKQENDQIYFDLSENGISTVDKTVGLRGGTITPMTKVLFKFILIWTMGKNHTPTKGFKPRRINQDFGPRGQVRLAPKLQENPLFRNNLNNPGGSCRAKQNNQDGTLTRQQKRNLPSPDDVIISEKNVIIRDGQTRYKIKKHGYDFGIESTQNSKGQFKTERTPENIQAFKEEIKNLVLNGRRIEGTYRKAEPDGYPASHFYDPETGRNAIFKKETTEFVSAWKLTEKQADDLLNNGNVGGYY